MASRLISRLRDQPPVAKVVATEKVEKAIMMRGLPVAGLLLLSVSGSLRAQGADDQLRNDWANLRRFRDSDAVLPAPRPGENRVVFMGNSITEGWNRYWSDEFGGKPYVNRGISGQTTPQMLVRFRQDVVALKPSVVVILAGTNDIAGNTGPSTLEMIEDNLADMTEIANANGIRAVLCSVLPVYDYPWRPGLQPAEKIVKLNAWMHHFADSTGNVYVDYHSAMKDERNGMRADLASDGVHPNEAGYKIMAPLVEQGITAALRSPPPRPYRR
jgi:lysophospholipase L1-like esterase